MNWIETADTKIREMVDLFQRLAGQQLDEEGIYPHIGVLVRPNGDTTIEALDLPYQQLLWHLWEMVRSRQYVGCMVGIDMTTRPDQGTLYEDVLVCIAWEAGPDDGTFHVGCLDYRWEPRAFHPINWHNTFWDAEMRVSLKRHRPIFRVVSREEPTDG